MASVALNECSFCHKDLGEAPEIASTNEQGEIVITVRLCSECFDRFMGLKTDD